MRGKESGGNRWQLWTDSQLFGIYPMELIPSVRIRAEGVIVGGRDGPQVQVMEGLQTTPMTLIEEGKVV